MTWGRWAGSEVAVLASGPSMTVADAELVRRWRDGLTRRVIVVNTTFRLAPWADVLYASDRQWWEMHAAEVERVFSGEMWTHDNPFHGKAWERARRIYVQRGLGLSRKPGILISGGNSGYTAISMAYEFGARCIYLLGFDMKAGPAGEVHWHGAHPYGLRQNPMFHGWLLRFPQLAQDLRKVGVEVVNCSRETALDCFARAAPEDVFSAEHMMKEN